MGTTSLAPAEPHHTNHVYSGTEPLNWEETAHAIVRAMNTRSFRREPPDLEKLLVQVSAAVCRNAPVPFLLYWGKGDRDAAGEAEQKALAFLDALAESVRTVYPVGAHFTVLFTDTHALLNGYAEAGVRDYQNSVQRLVETYGMELVPMSEFVGLDLEGLAREASNVTVEPALVAMSRKHYKRSEDYRFGAQVYCLQTLREKQVVQRVFPNHVFLTYNGSSLDVLLPTALAVFYMYSLKRGISAKPWFLNGCQQDRDH